MMNILRIVLFYTAPNGLTAMKRIEVAREWINAHLTGKPAFEHLDMEPKQTWHTAGDLVHVQVTLAGNAVIEYGNEAERDSVQLGPGEIAVWQDKRGGHMAVTGEKGWSTIHMYLDERLPE